MNNLPLAFLLGLLGSLHCAVMCGPLMLSLPISQNNYLNSAIQLVVYQMGRILVYTLFGLLAGALGGAVVFFTNQEILGTVIGCLMVLFSLAHFTGKYITQLNKLQSKMILPVSRLMGMVYKLRFWGFFAGILNGLIPCGMVYLALATSMHAGSMKGGAIFMLLFGLGTTPLMLIISLGGIYLKRYFRFSPQKLIPWFTLFIGFLFLFRSANLGIPFLSPNNQHHAGSPATGCK